MLLAACRATRRWSAAATFRRALAAAAPNASSSLATHIPLDRIRNIGIIAHIDAGKTTTTERILHYAGITRSIGDVDEGDTVMDFMKQEQERGITIQSAAITFGWRDHKVNLIDTPGHVDFTIEVERSIRVLDGAVAILDATSGVEVQTEVVWRQAQRNSVPRIVFINKLDRVGANVDICVDSLRDRLGARPVLLQQAVFDREGDFTGTIVDLIDRRVLTWSDDAGKSMQDVAISEHPHGPKGVEEAETLRNTLVDAVAEFDDALLEKLMECESASLITGADLRAALRRVTLSSSIVPVLCGASFRNRGVQPLIDAVVDYLPSPLDRPALSAVVSPSSPSSPRALFPADPSADLLAYAFKVTVDKQRGPLVFLRVYAGTLSARVQVSNATRGTKERITRLHQVYAKRLEDIDDAEAGNIVMAVGLKGTATGDALVANNDKRRITLPGLEIPPPVFFRSIEAESVAHEPALQEALDAMLLEDPSLVLRVDADTGQRQLGGQGELHLEIIADRLQTDFNISARLGPILIALRETLEDAGRLLPVGLGSVSGSIDREIGGRRHAASLHVAISSSSADGISVKMTPLTDTQLSALSSSGLDDAAISAAALEGVRAALGRGPLLGYPVVRAAINITADSLSEASSPLAVQLAAADGVRRLLARPEAARAARLLEPVMTVSITVPDGLIGTVLSDLTGRRRAAVRAVDALRPGTSRLMAVVPLREMVGYASALRSVTSGAGAFTMTFEKYDKMGAEAQAQVMTEHGRAPIVNENDME